jgi:hypothetical protein
MWKIKTSVLILCSSYNASQSPPMYRCKWVRFSWWHFSSPYGRKDITKKHAKLQNQKDRMLIEVKGYVKFERVLWYEIDTICSDMFVARISVLRTGRSCCVEWLGWSFQHVTCMVCLLKARIHQGIVVYSWGLRHGWFIFCIPTRHLLQIPFIWPSFFHLWNPLRTLAY